MTRWTARQFMASRAAALQERQADNPPPVVIPKDKYKSKWERQYADILEFRRVGGEIKRWRYEPITLVLADGVRYSPDFWVTELDDRLSVHEVKGRMHKDARIKILLAVEAFPEFAWYIVRGDMVPHRMYSARDVPSADRAKGKAVINEDETA